MTSVYAPPEIALEWQRRLHARGWVVPAWPVEHGGCGWSLVTRRYIWAQRGTAAAGAPPVSPMGVGMCGPVLIGHGSAAQQARFLPPHAVGRRVLVPGLFGDRKAGSDLASLRMIARDATATPLVCDRPQDLDHPRPTMPTWIFMPGADLERGDPAAAGNHLSADRHDQTPGIDRPADRLALGRAHPERDLLRLGVRAPKSATSSGAVGQGWTRGQIPDGIRARRQPVTRPRPEGSPGQRSGRWSLASKR